MRGLDMSVVSHESPTLALAEEETMEVELACGLPCVGVCGGVCVAGCVKVFIAVFVAVSVVSHESPMLALAEEETTQVELQCVLQCAL